MKKFRNASLLAALAGLAVAPMYAGASDPKEPCTKQTTKNCPTVTKGRMTGHGHFVRGDGKVQWEFRNSVCNANRFPDLKVEWGDGNKFRLTSYSVPLRCVDFPGVSEGMPRAGFDSIIGQGEGVLNGRPASATFKFTDFGEPGREDRGTITILNEDDEPVLRVNEQEITGGGNHQAHRR